MSDWLLVNSIWMILPVVYRMDVNYIKVGDCIVPQAIVELHFCEIELRLGLSKGCNELPVAVSQKINARPIVLA